MASAGHDGKVLVYDMAHGSTLLEHNDNGRFYGLKFCAGSCSSLLYGGERSSAKVLISSLFSLSLSLLSFIIKLKTRLPPHWLSLSLSLFFLTITNYPSCPQVLDLRTGTVSLELDPSSSFSVRSLDCDGGHLAAIGSG